VSNDFVVCWQLLQLRLIFVVSALGMLIKIVCVSPSYLAKVTAIIFRFKISSKNLFKLLKLRQHAKIT
jgi:hypothetical protein